MVRIARHTFSGHEFAIKFYIFASTFRAESAIYQDRNSGLKLPRVRSPSIHSFCHECFPVACNTCSAFFCWCTPLCTVA